MESGEVGTPGTLRGGESDDHGGGEILASTVWAPRQRGECERGKERGALHDMGVRALHHLAGSPTKCGDEE